MTYYVIIDVTMRTFHKVQAQSRGEAVQAYLQAEAEENGCTMSELTHRELLIATADDFGDAFEAAEYEVKIPPKVEESVLLSFSRKGAFEWLDR